MWVGCLAHGLDLLIKDICKLLDAPVSVQEHREVHQHDKTRQLFLVHSPLHLLLPRTPASATAIHPLPVRSVLTKVRTREWTKFSGSKERRDKPSASRQRS
jgi:hypothetical protein